MLDDEASWPAAPPGHSHCARVGGADPPSRRSVQPGRLRVTAGERRPAPWYRPPSARVRGELSGRSVAVTAGPERTPGTTTASPPRGFTSGGRVLLEPF